MASTSEAEATMAPPGLSSPSTRLPGRVTKLPPIPEGAKVEKRPLIRRQPPASSKSRIIYVSSRTPFIAIVKRARKQLERSAKNASAAPKGASVHARIEALKKSTAVAEDGATVVVMGTGRAVEKTLSVASWFEQLGEFVVEVRTRTRGALDDIVVEGDVEDETRLRKVSCLEVSIKLK